MKKFLAVLVAMMLTLLPLAASAESDTGFASIKLNDLVISFEGLSLDFSGIGLDLSMASDTQDPANPNVTVAAAVLSEGEEVLSGVAAVNLEQLAFLLSGMKGTYKIGLDEILGDSTDADTLANLLEALPSTEDMDLKSEELNEELQKIMNLEELGEEEIELGGETVTAKITKTTMDKDAILNLYAKLFDFMGMSEMGTELTDQMFGEIDEMNVVVTVYEIDEYNAVEDIELRMVSGDEVITGEGRFTVVVPESGEGLDMSGSMTMKPEDPEISETIDMDLSVKYGDSDAFEGAYEMKMDMTMNATDTEGFPASITMDVVPKAVEGGWHYDYSIGFETSGQGGFAIIGSSENAGGKLNSECILTFEDDTMTMQIEFALTGDITESNGDIAFSGDLQLGMTVDGSNFALNAKVETLTSDSIDGKLVSIEGLNARDIMDMTVTEVEDMQNEAMAVVGDAAMKLMENPGVRAVMSMFESDTTEVVEPDVETAA